MCLKKSYPQPLLLLLVFSLVLSLDSLRYLSLSIGSSAAGAGVRVGFQTAAGCLVKLYQNLPYEPTNLLLLCLSMFDVRKGPLCQSGAKLNCREHKSQYLDTLKGITLRALGFPMLSLGMCEVPGSVQLRVMSTKNPSL